MLKTANAEFSFIGVWFTGQNNRPLDIEHNMNITLIIATGKWEVNEIFNWTKKKKICWRIFFFLNMGMSFARKFGDKYGKTLVITATKIGKGAAKIASKRIVPKNSRSNRKLDSR